MRKSKNESVSIIRKVLSLSLGRESTPGQTRTGLGLRIYPFYYPRLLHCLDQMLAMMLKSQHRVLLSKTVRPCAPCGPQCIGHAIRTWSAVCSVVPHLHFGERAKPHLCMDEWNTSPQAVELNPSCLGQACPNRLGTGPGQKNTESGRIFIVLCIPFMVCPLKSTDAKSKRFCTAGTNGHLDFNLSW